ncbi:zinc metalloproteinase nas-4-like [Anopheles aquasalis]|uniref:zinc metalloproteinase nas-4-like n=1 Tax=Anopheles aquasalis TaxID=42839 RepID=UPI00215A36C2|nr:zinc metalloproteinase nas-4-like [Anopheles aquasalis]
MLKHQQPAFLSKASFVATECTKSTLQYGNVVQNVLPKDYRWPNATIPYMFDESLLNTPQRTIIRAAMEVLQHRTCVRFVERSREVQHLLITAEETSGCWADTGQQTGTTYLNLPSYCTQSIGTILHELLHALGFLHQHTRPDRDRYVCVRYENVLPQPSALYNYEIVWPWTHLAFPLPYDFESIMHYTPDMYSIAPGRSMTMVPRHPWNISQLGQRNHLTEHDVLAIHFVYCV